MNCEREIEVLDAVMSGRWPEGCEPELRAHASRCSLCTDVVTVAGAIHEDHTVAMHEAPLPTASMVWRRAQLRSRREAIQAATRAITAVQTGTIAAAVVIGAALIGGVGALLSHISDGIHFGAFDFAPSPGVLLLAAAAAGLAFAPVAVWVLVSED